MIIAQIEGKVTATNRKKKRSRTNFIANDRPNGERSKRRYPTCTNYCWIHGYGIHPKHPSRACNNKKDDHNDAATISNMLGELTTNVFHHKLWCWKASINNKINRKIIKTDLKNNALLSSAINTTHMQHK